MSQMERNRIGGKWEKMEKYNRRKKNSQQRMGKSGDMEEEDHPRRGKEDEKKNGK